MEADPLATSTEDRRPLLLVATWVWTSVAIVFVTLRFYCRVRLVRSVWWDDYMILASVLFTIAMSVIWTIYANDGGCRHLASLTKDQVIQTARLNWISQPMCVGGLTTGKISVACLIYRLQSPTRWRTQLLIGLCAFMCMVNTTVVVLMFTQCTPVKLLWDHTPVPGGHCMSPRVVAIISQSASSYMAFLDLVLAAIPVHMIWSLQMHKKKKVAICCLLSTGISAFGFAVVKIIELANDSNHGDLTWATVLLFVWNAFEINIVIIAACVPTLVPLFEIVTGRKNSGHFAKSSGRYYASQSRSFQLRERAQRVDSTSKSDTESVRDILAPKNTVNTVSSPSQNHLNTDLLPSSNYGQSKIAVTRQWSIVGESNKH